MYHTPKQIHIRIVQESLSQGVIIRMFRRQSIRKAQAPQNRRVKLKRRNMTVDRHIYKRINLSLSVTRGDYVIGTRGVIDSLCVCVCVCMCVCVCVCI